MSKYTNTTIIENPSLQALEWVREMERKKIETKKELRKQKDKYFPKK